MQKWLQNSKLLVLKQKLEQISLPVKNFNVGCYLFPFVNWRKLLSTIIRENSVFSTLLQDGQEVKQLDLVVHLLYWD